MKLSFRTILPIILISALLILLNGCIPTTTPTPGATTGGTITGIFETPEACCIANRDHTEGWVPLVNATVSVIDSKDVTHTTKTDSDGKYWLTDVAPGIYYVITACCECEDGEGVYKDVVEEELKEGDTYDAGIADCESSALGLMVDYLLSGDVFVGEDCNDYCNCFDEESQIYALLVTTGVKLRVAAVNLQNPITEPLEKIRANADFQGFVVELCDLLEACCVEPGVTLVPPPGPPPTDPCVGHSAPEITTLLPLQATAGQEYTGTVSATDVDNDALTFSLTLHPTGMSIHPDTGKITWTPGCEQICECLQLAEMGRTEEPNGGCIPNIVTVKVTDACHSAEKTFCIEVTNNEPVLDLKDKEVTAPDTFIYDVSADASDAEGDILNYYLVAPPAGMTIGLTTGVITWAVVCDDADCTSNTFAAAIVPCIPKDYLIEVKVTDACHPDGVVDTFTLTVKPCEYELTVLVNPSGKGTPNGAGTYPQNSIAPISVTDLELEYEFVDWTGDAVLGSTIVNSNTVLMDADKIVTANLRWHEVYEPFCRFAFEDLPILPYAENDWDYNDWVGDVDIKCQYLGEGLEEITFTVTHEHDGAGLDSEVWFKIPANTFSSTGTYVLNGGASTAFDNTIVNDFKFISSVELLSGGETFTLVITFGSPFSFTCSPFVVSDIFGKSIFFQAYLHVLDNPVYGVPDYVASATDPRRLAVPGSWTYPDEGDPIWDDYAKVTGSSSAGPNFNLEDGTWTTP